MKGKLLRLVCRDDLLQNDGTFLFSFSVKAFGIPQRILNIAK